MHFNFPQKAGGGCIYLYDKTLISQENHLAGETHVTPRLLETRKKGQLFFQKGPDHDQKGGLSDPQRFYEKIVIK
jgi:hypothetical protein